MGGLAESMLGHAVEVVEKLKSDDVAPIFEAEQELDRMQIEIDQQAIRILTEFHPVGNDLRLILSVCRITSELERIGDHATNICESLQLMASQTLPAPNANISKMGGLVVSAVRKALMAFRKRNVEEAREAIASDDMIDALNDMVTQELLLSKVTDDQKTLAGALSQILIASSLERIADQATNIGEEVVYMVEGTDIRHTNG